MWLIFKARLQFSKRSGRQKLIPDRKDFIRFYFFALGLSSFIFTGFKRINDKFFRSIDSWSDFAVELKICLDRWARQPRRVPESLGSRLSGNSIQLLPNDKLDNRWCWRLRNYKPADTFSNCRLWGTLTLRNRHESIDRWRKSENVQCRR